VLLAASIAGNKMIVNMIHENYPSTVYRLAGRWIVRLARQQARARNIGAVKQCIAQFGHERFLPLSDANDERDGRVRNRAGYRRVLSGTFDMPKDRTDYLILTKVFKKVLCEGLEARQVASDLADANCLRKGARGNLTQVVWVPGAGWQRFYVVSSTILELEI
jgi:uncharacterized protein (DUF927 family)